MKMKRERGAKRFFSRLARPAANHPWAMLGIIAVISVAAAIGALRVELEFSQRSLLPKGYPSVETISQVEDTFGGIQYAKVLLTGEDLSSAKSVLPIYEYERDSIASEEPALGGDYVRRVDTYISNLARNPQAQALLELYSGVVSSETGEDLALAAADFLASPGAAYLRDNPQAKPLFDLLERAAGTPSQALKGTLESALGAAVEEAVRQYLASPGGDFVLGKNVTKEMDAALIDIQVRPDLPQAQALVYAERLKGFTEDFFAASGLTPEMSGETLIIGDIQDMSMRDAVILGAAALAFIVLVLFLTFRKALDVVLTLAVVLLSTLWVFGLMGFAGVRFTIMGIAIIPLLLGIDIAYSIHILTRYYEERDKGRSASECAVGSVSTVGVAVFLAAATTMFGFLSFSISDLPPIVDFGWLCLAGVSFGFALSVTLLPAALVIRDRRRKPVERRRVESHRLMDWLDRGLARLSLLAERHRKVVWAGTLVLVAGCMVLASGLSTSADIRTFVPQDLPAYEVFGRIEGFFGGQDKAVALVEGEDLLSPDGLRLVDEFGEKVLTDPRNRTPSGMERYFKTGRMTSLPGLFKAVYGALPSSEREAEEGLRAIGEEYGFDTAALITGDGTSSLVVFDVLFVDEEGEKEMAAILSDAAAAISGMEQGLSVRVTGMPLIVADTMDKLFSTQLETGGLALVLCALLVMAIFQSFSYGLAATSVVFLAIVLELGILRLMGWPLDIMTVMIASMVIGAGIDFGIHVAHRFQEETGDNGLAPEEAVNSTVRNVGNALISAAVTTCGAFLILSISSLSTLRRFGVITAIALASACFAALVLEPTFLASIALRKWKNVKNNEKRGMAGEGA